MKDPQEIARQRADNTVIEAEQWGIFLPRGTARNKMIDLIAASIQAAIDQERERCVNIAAGTQITYDVEKYNEMNGYNAARHIAAQIRSGE